MGWIRSNCGSRMPCAPVAPHIFGQFRELGLVECLEKAKASPHYQAPLGENQGRAVAMGFWRNGGGTSSASVVHEQERVGIRVDRVRGSFRYANIACHEIAAETLGISVNEVRAEIPDYQQRRPHGRCGREPDDQCLGAGGEPRRPRGHPAVQGAGRPLDGTSRREQVEWRDGKAINTTREEELTNQGDLPGRAGYRRARLRAARRCVRRAVWGRVSRCTFGDVEVDPDTGKTTVLRYTAIQDAGCAIHPSYVEGQFQGGGSAGYRLGR